ncbi:EAL domain-containing protein [Salinisphaera aquimarina]|uniref:EAL domain-containing protein n=1 Tax=Salinisphaera aquimarina TaxID=2094031 RepID=A0ABV7EWJ0_9GAMM
MKKPLLRRSLAAGIGLGLGVILTTQLGVFWLQTHDAGALPIVMVLAIGAVAAVLLALAGLYASRTSTVVDTRALTAWLDEIDLADEASAPERPNADASRVDAALIASVQGLVLRSHQYREKLLVRHQRVQRLLRNVSDMLYHADRDGRITWVTDTVQDMLGYTPAELEGRPLRDLLANPDADLDKLTLSAQLSRHPTRCFRRDGSVAWMLISSRRIDDGDGQAIGSEGVCRDGTRLIETQQALNQEKERAQVTLSSIGDGVITTNARGDVDYLNPRAEQMLGISAAAALTLPFDTLCNFVDTARNVAVNGLVRDCIAAGEMREWDEDLTLYDRAPRSTGHAVKVTVAPIRDLDKAVVGAVIVLHDVSRLHQISREMTYQANHDMLTGLPNRRAFEKMLAGFLTDAGDRSTHHALCYLDLDQFKLVNDSCGHNAGDEMLRQLTAQLASRLRANDTLARLGGDEFGVVMRNLSLTDAKAKAETLRAEIDSFRFRWERKLFRLSASIGIAAIDGNEISATELLRRADTACYLAKEKGRNQVHIYRGDSDETLTRHGDMHRMQLISEALDNDGFVLYAQVMQPLKTDINPRIGVELLLRMRGDLGEIVSPQNFLLTAERYNAASRIDRWVLRRALTLITEARPRHGGIEHYSINISGQSITDEHFVDYAIELIQSSAVDPRVLVFEITETTAVTNTGRASELMRSLRALGCRFSLDDFGSGLSSFSYLKYLPSDFIKIDGKLVSRILDEPVERAIVEAINQVGQAMGLMTVAEHVESLALLDALEAIGVDYAQGYHVARPVPFEQLVDYLDSQPAIQSAN